VLLQPPVHVEVVVLLRPEHPGERLPVHAAFVLAHRRRGDPIVELVGLGQPLLKDVVERPERIATGAGGQPQAHDLTPAAGTSRM